MAEQMKQEAAGKAIPAGYQQTEVGVIPEDWSTELLGNLAEKVMVGIASAATHAYCRVGIPLIRNQNIKPNKLDADDLLFINETYESSFKGKRLKAGDLLTARTGYPGTTCIVPPEFENAQSFTTLITRPTNKINSLFLSIFMNSDVGIDFFDKNQIGGGQKNINAATLKNFIVAFPDSKEQTAIANVLSDSDALIDALEQLIAKKQAIKSATMQQLLTGRTRLPAFALRPDGTPKGYKPSELGEIPEDWACYTFNDVVDSCSSGATPYRGNKDFYKGTNRWITSGELNYCIINDTIEKISDEAIKKSNLNIHPQGTFLMAITGLEAAGTRGACGIVGRPATTNQSCMAIYPNEKIVVSIPVLLVCAQWRKLGF